MFFPQRADAEFVAPQQQHLDPPLLNDMFNRYRSARADRTRRRLNYQDAQTVNQFGAAMRDPVPQLVQDLYSEDNDHAKLISAVFRTNIPVETLAKMWDIYDHLILHQIYTAIFEGHQHNQQERRILEFLILEKGYRPSLVLKLLDPELLSNFIRLLGRPDSHEFLNFLQRHPHFRQFFPE